MPPPYLISGSFLGRSLAPGVNPIMLGLLTTVEVTLQTQFSALPQDRKIDPNTGQPTTTVAGWSGLRENPGTWRGHAHFHSSGSAIDLDTSRNPYIATRTFSASGAPVFGGERPTNANPLTPAQLDSIRAPAVAVYDRAMQFMRNPLQSADVGARRPGESTDSCFDRFALVSELLGSYLAFACKSDLDRIPRQPVANVESVATTLLDGLPSAERKDKASAVSDLNNFMTSTAFMVTHPLWPLTPAQQYYRILRDYELVRIPMVFGSPSVSPNPTRNPVRGFLTLRREIVIAMCDVARLRWGACDLGGESGDMMHFDQGTHGLFVPSDS